MNDRQKQIISILETKKSVTIDYLCEHLVYSRSTIRRDIIGLEEMGVVRREKGRVNLRIGRAKEKSFKLRNLENLEAKEKLCLLAKDFVTEGMSLFLDGSSTVRHMAKFLEDYEDLTVITNGIELAYELIQMPNIELFVVGGYVREGTSAVVGESALDYIGQFNADLCILSCNGIDENGIYEASMQQAVTKKRMLEQSEIRLVLCDESKFYKKFKFTLANHREIDYIVSDHQPQEIFGTQLKEMGCELLKAD
ncbi:MAG: DeoR/GlpR family DNA-binding transcription regulator [Cellulosilyticaceae bacterium]